MEVCARDEEEGQLTDSRSMGEHSHEQLLLALSLIGVVVLRGHGRCQAKGLQVESLKGSGER